MVEEVFSDIFSTCCGDGLLFQQSKSASGHYIASGVLFLNTASYRPSERFPTHTSVILEV